MTLNRPMPRIDTSRFSMIPRADVPRSTFITTHAHKTTFQTGYLVPIHIDEVLPGDVHSAQITIFARLATPLFPIMDAMTLETFFFFVPNRLVWDNWKKMMGERVNPSDSISFTLPQIQAPSGGYAVASLQDYLGLPVAGMALGAQVWHNALPLRAYNLIWDEWFRDQNLQNSLNPPKGDGPDTASSYTLLRRNKKHDYFTSALPWPLKGGVDVSVSLGGQAAVKGIAFSPTTTSSTIPGTWKETGGTLTGSWPGSYLTTAASSVAIRAAAGNSLGAAPEVYADLSTATGQTINAIRLAFQTQRLLERDARGGTRYTELLRSHFGVESQDQRLQRPEYIGGGRSDIHTQAIPQTSATGLTGGTSPLGALGAAATVSDQHSFHYSATEHGYIIGLAHATGEITYQQGLHRLWTRMTRYDFYWPAFAHLGEQAIRNDEIYVTGLSTDAQVFGYQERWAEYRHKPSRISGLFRSTSTGTIDPWHLAQKFTSLPALNSAFIQDTPPISRALAAGTLADNMQILFDSVFRIRSTRPMPMYSVPGMIDRF